MAVWLDCASLASRVSSLSKQTMPERLIGREGEMSFTDETFRFLAELEDNNSKEWFDANRPRYDQHWKTAALDFIADLGPDMQRMDPPLKAVPKVNGSLRRINRDVRFSKDKSPYNAQLHMIFWAGDHPNRSAAMHVVLTPTGVGYGAGWFGLDPAALTRLRSRIVDPTQGHGLDRCLEKGRGCRMYNGRT